MINKLFISNYAIINRLEVDFSQGFTTITGETGAGKSIILGALNLLLGNKFDSVNFKDKTSKSIIEGSFNISHLNIKDFFSINNLDYEDSVIIRREFLFEGKSRSFVNDTPVKLDLLKKLGIFLVDIHSQHESLLINNEDFQIDFIDQFANQKFVEFATKDTDYKNLFHDLQLLKMDIESKKRICARGLDVTYQKQLIENIDKLDLMTDEKEKLEIEYKRMNNIHKIKDVLSQVLLLFENVDNSIMTNLHSVDNQLSNLQEYDQTIKKLLVRVKQNTIDLDDVLMELHTVNQALHLDSGQLERLEDRINAINSLENTLNVFSVEEILKKRNAMQHEIDSLDNILDEIQKLEVQANQITIDLFDMAKGLSSLRKKATEELIILLEKDLLTLGMKNPSVKFDITQKTDLTPKGIDKVNLLFSSNKGHELKPLVDIGSGGEIARLMLCVKKQLFSMNHFSTIIFDEIDSGVSGEIGRKMGRILQKIALKGQVICITHLPQIASLGNFHYRVSKIDDSNFSTTIINNLTEENRVQEIARMLSGEEVNSEAIANAKKMLDI